MDEGLFISIEGIEGAGKTSQIKLLEDFFSLRRYPFISTREPGGTAIGNEIRQLLLNPKHKDMVGLTELFLYAAARAQHVEQVIKPALEAGKIVLCDRFTDATFAYQGAARGFTQERIQSINQWATGGLMPRLTLLLDCPVEMGLKRARDRYFAKEGGGAAAGGDRIEREELSFHEKVREQYLKIAHQEPNRMVIIDASNDMDSTYQMIIREIERAIKSWKE